MMSHCLASLKLTRWHEGTFASSVMYSPPQPHPRPSSCLQPSISTLLFTPASKMTFIILSLSRSHSFPAARNSEKKKRWRKWSIERPNRSSARVCRGNWRSSPRDPRPVLKMATWRKECDRVSGEMELCVRGKVRWVRAQGKDCLSEYLQGFQQTPIRQLQPCCTNTGGCGGIGAHRW